MKPWRLAFSALVAAWLIPITSSWPRAAQAALLWTDNIVLNCAQPRFELLFCNYRLIASQPLLGITARAAGRDLPISRDAGYPAPDELSAILFLVDTSDPGREHVVRKNAQQIRILLAAARPHHHFGLANFDSRLIMHAPLGSEPANILLAADRLHALGKSTELYRSVIEAARLLKSVPARRRFLFLFSDGQAEDRAYFHEDAIRAARDAQVSIVSFGYARSPSLSVALQTLRRLSEETGGFYVEADASYDLPSSFLSQPYANLDSGGTVEIDLTLLLQGPHSGPPEVSLSFALDTGPATLAVPIRLPAPAQPVTATIPTPGASPATLPATPPQPAVQIIRQPSSVAAQQPDWLWRAVTITLVVLTLMGIATLLVLLRQSHAIKKTSAAPVFKPYAYLVRDGPQPIRHSITRQIWRIGRSSNNELVLKDNSISRRHAEIHRHKDGSFTIHDLNSLNGVFVNDRKVTEVMLKEGDVVDIGDVSLRFTLEPADQPAEESTLLQATRAPRS